MLNSDPEVRICLSVPHTQLVDYFSCIPFDITLMSEYVDVQHYYIDIVTLQWSQLNDQVVDIL